MSAGHFGQILLFLPLYAILELPYLHGARDLARKEGRIGLKQPIFSYQLLRDSGGAISLAQRGVGTCR